MPDLRPPLYLIGLLVAALGASMTLPMAVDWAAGNGHWGVFASSAVITTLSGGLIALACANGVTRKLTLQQTFLLTTGVWVALPLFAALPFVLGATGASATDAFFEAMSGLTTTGGTVLTGLAGLPDGILLWRGLLQWFGGIGIIVVAMALLPELKVGGMQIFRAEAFDTDKVLPRAAAIAGRIAGIYIGLTGVCALTYLGFGMRPLDAAVHAMTTIATGGFANYDSSFAVFGPAIEWSATLFMLLAALPFVRYVQFLNGEPAPLWRDPQIRAFLLVAATLIGAMTVWRWAVEPGDMSLRETAFNVTSILTGTGYASSNYMLWGALPVAAFFFIGLIGGCAGSTSCSIKIFRYQLLFASIKAHIRRIHQPHGVFAPRYDGRPVGDDVLSSVMSFFVLFIGTLAIVTIGLGTTGLDLLTAVSGAATALANVGPGLGDVIGPAGNFAPLPDAAKWMLSAAMLIGRLEVLAVYVLFVPAFWRA
ncbi:trk system potassium uptake protein TrkH [Hasllibacter halocynthiae]|uniref:Trk system potassium uptake protein n=1 Tax=Hasllibacter halocynthiae TaxID=595589 RepID=A0A2T0X6G9_9RHOB|nr:TrkH family potassium uptake protein [Hasllibacter halocynthiae]PRY94485.1 trk system potassium uptake protein TrkH [Hasllibacter halocynthiae]